MAKGGLGASGVGDPHIEAHVKELGRVGRAGLVVTVEPREAVVEHAMVEKDWTTGGGDWCVIVASNAPERKRVAILGRRLVRSPIFVITSCGHGSSELRVGVEVSLGDGGPTSIDESEGSKTGLKERIC